MQDYDHKMSQIWSNETCLAFKTEVTHHKPS